MMPFIDFTEDRLDMQRESRAWAAARNVPDDVPDDVMTEHEFLYGHGEIPGFAAHTEAAIRRIAHNSIVALDAREQAMGDLEEALAHLFDDTDPTPLSMRLTAARRAWQSWKENRLMLMSNVWTEDQIARFVSESRAAYGDEHTHDFECRTWRGHNYWGGCDCSLGRVRS